MIHTDRPITVLADKNYQLDAAEANPPGDLRAHTLVSLSERLWPLNGRQSPV